MTYDNILLFLLLRAIPEGIGLVAVGTVLVGTILPMSRIVAVGSALGVAMWLIRLLPLKFGIHLSLCIMAAIVLVRVLLGFSMEKAVKSALFGYALLGLLDLAGLLLVLNFTGITEEHLLADDWAKLLGGLPSLIGLYLVAWLGRVFLKKKGKEEVVR